MAYGEHLDTAWKNSLSKSNPIDNTLVFPMKVSSRSEAFTARVVAAEAEGFP